jgi:hypothetical protein
MSCGADDEISASVVGFSECDPHRFFLEDRSNRLKKVKLLYSTSFDDHIVYEHP